MLGSYLLYALDQRLFCSTVRSPGDLVLQTPQLIQIAAARLAPTSLLVTLDCILNLKQLWIVGMDSQSLRNPSQGRKQIAGRVQLCRLRYPVLHRAFFFLVNNKTEDRFGRGMGRVQCERLMGERLGLQPIGFYNGLRMLDQRVGQNRSGES